jgi:hypothetical protein
MKTVSLKIPDEVDAKLKQLSQERGAAKSDIIRDALECYFANRKNGGKLSCSELAGDLVGSVSGPVDLATNPKHMQGYGR